MKDMFYSFSEQTVYLRYHGILRSMPHNRLQLFCNIDYETEMALVSTFGAPGREEVVAVGRYMADPAKQYAELAFVVRDDWQRKGLGSELFRRLIDIGRDNGIHRFHADVLIANSGMLKIFHRSGLHIHTTTDPQVVRVSMSLPEDQSIS
jgi:RimJ/RimL family protein N-acetyltransferase